MTKANRYNTEQTIPISKLTKGDFFKFVGGKAVYVYDGKTRGRNSKFTYYKFDDINAHYETTLATKTVVVGFDF